MYLIFNLILINKSNYKFKTIKGCLILEFLTIGGLIFVKENSICREDWTYWNIVSYYLLRYEAKEWIKGNIWESNWWNIFTRFRNTSIKYETSMRKINKQAILLNYLWTI